MWPNPDVVKEATEWTPLKCTARASATSAVEHVFKGANIAALGVSVSEIKQTHVIDPYEI